MENVTNVDIMAKVALVWLGLISQLASEMLRQYLKWYKTKCVIRFYTTIKYTTSATGPQTPRTQKYPSLFQEIHK